MQSLNKYAEMARLSQSWHKVPTMLFYNLVTTLAQPDTTLYFETVARLLQGGSKVVTRLYKHCHKVATMHLVTTLYFETVTRLLQGGGKAVKRLYHNLATTLYYETVIRLSQGFYNSS